MYFTKDVRILFATRITRLFAYGFLSVVLALYLIEAGLSAWQIGMLLALTLAGDAAISLWLTTNADRIGRRRMLTVGAVLMLLAGVVFLLTRNPLVLTAAAIVGVISPSGNEIGPFLSIEQAALSQLVADENRTRLFAWYNLAGSFATATGALAGGWLAQSLQSNSWTKLASVMRLRKRFTPSNLYELQLNLYRRRISKILQLAPALPIGVSFSTIGFKAHSKLCSII